MSNNQNFSISSILYAARFFKNLPLLFTFLSGVFLIESANLGLLSLCLFTILCASFFMTHINVITDYELDKDSKPQFYKALSQNFPLAKRIIILELSLSILGITTLILLGEYLTGIFILLFSLVAVLYSYNFFSLRPKMDRLKVYWWGHLFVIITGYTSLWLAGLFLGNQQELDLLFWIITFIVISFSEYGVFLLESSIDYKEERASKIQSMSTLIGEKNTIRLSAFIGVVALIVACVLALVNPDYQKLIVLAVLPAMFVRFVFELLVVFEEDITKRQGIKKNIPDVLFIGTRFYTLTVIIILS